MDDLEADLLGILKPSSRPGKTAVKGPGKCDSSGGTVKATGKLLAPEKEPPAPRTPLHATAPVRRREELTFEDGADELLEELTFEADDDELMDALGFGNGPKGDEKQGKKEKKEELLPARSKLDELLGRGSVAKVLGQPGMGERREFQLDKKNQKQPEKEEGWDKEDFVFGEYQPTVASVSRGQPRRQAVRFSAENSSDPNPEPCSKPPAPASRSPVRGGRAAGDWLGLEDDVMDSEPPCAAKASPAVRYPSPATAGRSSPARQLLAAEEAVAKANPQEEEDWLSAALSRKKAQAQAKAQERSAKPWKAPGEGLDPCSPISQPAASTGAPQQAAALQDQAASADGSGQPVPGLSTAKQPPARSWDAAEGDPSGHASVPALFPGEQETQAPAPLAQDTTPRAHLQAAPQPQAESPALGLLPERRLGAPAAQLYEDTSGCQAALLSAQARVAELESQVRELEQGQHKLLLESLQQRHREDLDHLESAHRNLVKVMEESCRQREESCRQWEEKLQQEKEQLTAQLLSQRRDAEQARAELLAQLQQRLAALEQQRVSVPGIHKDHREQLQHPRAQETDAATSATLSTRSLNKVMEQIEKHSGDLHNLLQKVEAIHHSTQQLAMEAQRRDKHFEVLQERLLQQQRDMEEERSRVQEVMAKMEARLGEQTLLLEQQRVMRATAEQSKVESLQRLLEEQQRVVTQERAELERTKSAFLEEQKAARQRRLEEQQKLAAEWAELRSWQQLSKERMGRDVDRALQRDSQREDTIMSLAKEQAELKIRGHELKAKEEQLVRDRKVLEEAWQELRLEKEKINWASLRVQQQEEEMKSMTKEQLSMAHQRWLKQLHEELPINPTTLLTTDQDLSAPTTGLSSTLGFLPPVGALPSHTPGDSRDILAVAGSAELYATLLLLKRRAQQDHDYLEEERFFLESLKKAPYNASSWSR